jgi:hypothetical protein
MTDDKTKKKAIEAAADIFGISFFSFLRVVVLWSC